MASKNKTKIILKHYFSLSENTFSIFQILVFRYPKAPIKMRIYFIPRYLTIMGRGLQKNLVFFLSLRETLRIGMSYRLIYFLQAGAFSRLFFVLFWCAHWHRSLFKNMSTAELWLETFFSSCFSSSFISRNPVY